MPANSATPSIAEAMRHVRHIHAEAPFRKSGSGQDLRAAQYIVDTLNGYGLDAALETFETYDSDPGEATLEIVSPARLRIEARACAHVEPTAGYVGEIIDVGPGGESDYDGKDVRGKVVLAEVSYAPATPEKARIAASRGVAGIILMNWGRGDEPGIPWRALKAVWGNPTPESWHDIPRLFGASISRKDGEAIRELLGRGKVEIRAAVTASRTWRPVSQPIAWLRAPHDAPEADQFVVVSGHLDSWSPGVTDNISGNAVMMEIARHLAAHRSRLRRSVVFCFWNGHEVAEAAGSAYFVDAHWERLNRDAVAYLNIDSVGMRGTGQFNIASCPELMGFTKACAAASLDRVLPIVQSNLERVGDQSFFGIGVSAATGRHSYAPEVVKRHNGATLGWYNHTEYDTFDVLDETVLAADLGYWVEVTRELATAPVLPHRYGARVDDLASRFARMLAGRADPAGLAVIPAMLEELKPAVAWFDRHMDGVENDAVAVQRANRTALRLARLLTFISSSACGKYDQDSYGLSTLKLPVPLLATFERYHAVAADSLDAKLLVTRLMRLRHSITDALQAAIDLLADHRAMSDAKRMPNGS